MSSRARRTVNDPTVVAWEYGNEERFLARRLASQAELSPLVEDAALAAVAALPFRAGEFDRVLANRVLYHLPDVDRGLAEIARVLVLGGTLVVVTYSDRHLAELYRRIGGFPPPAPFSCENGEALLGRRLHPVERRETTGTARFADLGSILALLEAHEEFGYFAGIDVEARLGELAFPYDVTFHHALFVAHPRAAER